jgi:hypothetical protein
MPLIRMNATVDVFPNVSVFGLPLLTNHGFVFCANHTGWIYPLNQTSPYFSGLRIRIQVGSGLWIHPDPDRYLA